MKGKQVESLRLTNLSDAKENWLQFTKASIVPMMSFKIAFNESSSELEMPMMREILANSKLLFANQCISRRKFKKLSHFIAKCRIACSANEGKAVLVTFVRLDWVHLYSKARLELLKT